jgi:uncharacterized membrane protein
MPFDQSWMGFGFVGGLEAGLISAAAGALLFVLFHWIGRRNRWSYGPQIGWAFLGASVLTASGDLWNLLYFNYSAGLQSLSLLRAKLAEVHDPDSMGLRVLCELLGVVIGIYLGWVLCGGHRRSGDGQS